MCRLHQYIEASQGAHTHRNGHTYDWNSCPLAPSGTPAEYTCMRSLGLGGGQEDYTYDTMAHLWTITFVQFYCAWDRTNENILLYDLSPQHYIVRTVTRKQYATAVNNELKEAILSLDKKAKIFTCSVKPLAH